MSNNVIYVLPSSFNHSEEVKGDKILLDFLHTPSIISIGGSLDMSVLNKLLEPVRRIWFTQQQESVQEPAPVKACEGTCCGGCKTSARPLPKPFYRYLRPKELNGKGVKSQGGAGVLVKLDPVNKKVDLSIAVCHSKDNFSYSLSRQICDSRMASGEYFTIEEYDSGESVLKNFEKALLVELYPNIRGCHQFFSKVPTFEGKHKKHELLKIMERILESEYA